jgi:hypothetical protein
MLSFDNICPNVTVTEKMSMAFLSRIVVCLMGKDADAAQAHTDNSSDHAFMCCNTFYL